MKRYHVITIAVLVGLIIGCSVPAQATSYEYGKTFDDVSVDAVDSDTCTITLDGDDYEFADCDDAEQFESGDIATLTRSANGKTITVVNSDHYEAELTY